jgi:hypothetical protein
VPKEGRKCINTTEGIEVEKESYGIEGRKKRKKKRMKLKEIKRN